MERQIPPTRRTLPLADLATGVQRIAGSDLLAVLAGLGHAPTGRREMIRAREQATAARRTALLEAVAAIDPQAKWAPAWAESAWTNGLFAGRKPAQVREVVDQVIGILAAGGSGSSRTEIAARLLGDAHALDSAGWVCALVTRALQARDGAGTEREVWERAGIPLDLVSSPVLTWGLPLIGSGAVALAARTMTDAGLPLHLSTVALRHEPLRVVSGEPILIVENPRLVEAAAELRLPAAVLCTNGNPTTAPTEAIAALRTCGARLRYHGDFDAPGLAMTARAAGFGCMPFLMSALEYCTALAAAAADGIGLPVDNRPAPATPWDPGLAGAFTRAGLIVHEERVMSQVLAAHAKSD